MRLPAWAAAFLAVAAALTLVGAMIVALNAVGAFERPVTQAVTIEQTRDDYGLRHGTTSSTSIGPGSRSDDYGLRHPAALPQSDRESDFGLRHPTFGSSIEPGSRSDDYGLRHPAP